MASAIDATKPEAGAATTASVRAQFATAKSEITALQLVAAPIQAGTAYALLREAAGATTPEMAPNKLFGGAGSPEATQTGSTGDLYQRTNVGLSMKASGNATSRGWAGFLAQPGTSLTGDVQLDISPLPAETIIASRNGVPVVYEWNAATPPAAGTPGEIWVYIGAAVADARTNILNAFNGVVDPANITYNGVAPHPFLATQDGNFTILALATAAGGDPIPSDGLVCILVTTMVGAGNIVHTFEGGLQPIQMRGCGVRIPITANHVAAGQIYLRMPKPYIATMAMGTYHRAGVAGTVGVTIANSFGNCLLTVDLTGVLAADLLDLMILGI